MLCWALPSLLVACWIPLLRVELVGGCQIPERWAGTWFQSGVRQPIVIQDNRISTKGRCLASDGDKFLVIDDKGICYRCVVIHEKHENVLQYKETFCVHSRDSLHSLCSLITGDALLYSMFREGAIPVPCPFRGGHTFTYNRGHGECRYPLSTIDSCTHDSRLLLRYQACPDVHATESAVEELQCLATWKEGSLRYLVGKIHHSHATSNEERYRCFVYEKVAISGLYDTELRQPRSDDVEYKVAQSGDATCNGLFSPMEGSRTMTLKRAPTLLKCKFPTWLTTYSHWHTLDYQRTYLFHHRNTTLHIANATAPTMSSDNINGGGGGNGGGSGTINPQQLSALNSEQDIRVVCTELKTVTNEVAHLIAHYTMGCQNGFICMTFYKRDDHVIELQTGLPTRRSEEACTNMYFDRNTLPYMTLVTTNPEQRTCPHFGKYSVTGVTRRERHTRSQHQSSNLQPIDLIGTLSLSNKLVGIHNLRERRELHSFTSDSLDGCSLDVNTLVVGCGATDTMEFRSDCDNANKPRVTSVYTCHGGWTENNTHFLITTPLSRSSRGARRYCFVYESNTANTIRFSTSSDTCTRDITSGTNAGNVLAFNITSLGQCSETSRSLHLLPQPIMILVLITITTWRLTSTSFVASVNNFINHHDNIPVR